MAKFKITKKHHKHINNPFPSTPKSLPFIEAILSFNHKKLSHGRDFSIGDCFKLRWRTQEESERDEIYETSGSLSIYHQSDPDKTIWSTIPGEAFISGGIINTEAEESRGSFAIKDGDVLFLSKHQTIEKIKALYRCDFETKGREYEAVFGDSYPDFEGTHFPVLIITGQVFGTKRIPKSRKRVSLTARYWFLLEQKSSTQIGFSVFFGEYNHKLDSRAIQRSNSYHKKSSKWKFNNYKFYARPTRSYFFEEEEKENERVNLKGFGEFNRVYITYGSDKEEMFYGFGEQFSRMEFKGRKVPILVQEQGIGRGDQPITFAANLVSYRSGGDWSTTYCPSPFYMTSKMKSLYLEGYSYSIFNLTKHDRVQIQVHGNSVKGRILSGHTPIELIESLTQQIGRPPPLPNWILSGAIVGMQGGTKIVRNVWDQLKHYDVPISAFWLQDWVGQRKTIIGSQLWWNWEIDHSHYEGWRDLVHDLKGHDISMMGYCNPCLVPTDEKTNTRRNLFEEAIDIIVKDENGDPYMMPNTCFDVSMLDLTNPNAITWFKQILKEMVENGMRGWMADFGEGLPLDAHLFSGEDPIEAHNRYPEIWARVNREFVEEWRLDHPDEESLLFFVRAGFRNSPKWAMLFWEGDQMVSWQENDGIKSSVVGLLSSGISGFPFNHSDIGGYCGVNMPFLKYRRSEELLLRWMELNAFTLIFRTHEGNKPSSNCQFYSNNNTLSHFARCAKIYKAWLFYRLELVKEAAEKGLPVIRHLFLHYPEDKKVQKFTYQQFLLGTEIMVVPVLDKGKKNVKVYFPLSSDQNPNNWVHIWTGENYRVEGLEVQIEAPIGYPAVFVKAGSHVGEEFLKNLKELNVL